MPDPRPPFHPLRFVDVYIENWKKAIVTATTFLFALWMGSEAYRLTGSGDVWIIVLFAVMALEISIMPRWTIYGRPIGMSWNGWLYRRVVSPLRANSDSENTP